MFRRKTTHEHHKNLSLEDTEGEVWRPVVGFETYYLVSNLWEFKSEKK